MQDSRQTPSLIPEVVHEYARRLKDGTLSGATFPFGGGDPDDPKMVPYLEAVAAGGDTEALKTLAGILAGSPLRLWHPYSQATVLHLFWLFSTFSDHPIEFRDRVNTALDDIVSSWGQGITGRKVSVYNPPEKRGQAPWLFPLLDQRDGFFSTPEALAQDRAAERFVECVDDLKSRIATRISWRGLRIRYRDEPPAGKEITVGETATAIREVFAEFLTAWKQSPTSREMNRAAQTALAVRKGRNPNDTAAYELLSLYTLGGEERRLTPGLIKHTLETLARRGIPPPKRHRLRRPRRPRHAK